MWTIGIEKYAFSKENALVWTGALITNICHLLSNFQEGNLVHESMRKISENLTKLREEIKRTQQDVIKNVSFLVDIMFFFNVNLKERFN